MRKTVRYWKQIEMLVVTEHTWPAVMVHYARSKVLLNYKGSNMHTTANESCERYKKSVSTLTCWFCQPNNGNDAHTIENQNHS